MQALGLRKCILLVSSTCFLAIGIQVFVGSCQEQRACRTHQPCRLTVTAAVGDAAAVVNGYKCNPETALCRISCTVETETKDCDVCKGFGCVSGVCVTKAGVDQSKCCTAEDATKCTTSGFSCNTNLGECRTGCSNHTHCDLCKGMACDFAAKDGGGDCVQKANVGKDAGTIPDATNCPAPPPEPEPEPTEEDAGVVVDDGTGTAEAVAETVADQ